MPKLLDAKVVEGKYLLKTDEMIEGGWKESKSQIDALLWFVGRQLKTSPMQAAAWASIPTATISRCRHGEAALPHLWILKFHELTAIPVSELRRAAFLPPLCRPHRNARQGDFK